MDLGITGRVALVLGSTSGLGLGIATALAAEGARVVITGRRAEVAEQRASELPGAVAIPVDLAADGAVGGLVDRVESEVGPIDIAVLNAGGPPPGPAESVSPADARAVFDPLVARQIELVQRVLPSMRERGWGRLIAVGSSGIQQPIATLALSNIARAGLAAYLKSLAGDVAAEGVTVNMVLPGRIATDRIAELDRNRAEREGADVESVAASSQAAIPARRYGTPAEFGAVAAFLAGQQASYVTGEQVRIDGGLVSSY
ncbi:MAG: SDR family oxidoreductase [Propionibacteriaceae bacterium]